MTPQELATLHAESFTHPRPWTAAEFADLLAGNGVFLVTEPMGFALGRVVAREAELLTIAVAPTARRQGVGGRLLAQFLSHAADRDAEDIFLEVSADNLAARALYHAAGFAQAGLRRGYYQRPDGNRADAILMRRRLAPEI
ncbi:MAG: ribosomal-protein-alanine N-acetyltransferase [Cereibacter sphaeroides]|uniref:[Ribosomal protein bS18]-alanine N-acetyltransferase n=1 Tax=Cereibacter sphaeroides TaxID=1063 RepID=A0A2W5SLH8_CERSP|nr:MAG: ribosomal-protein-alanine N-acetyltransferase [Cereibacter sphaeroides]